MKTRNLVLASVVVIAGMMNGSLAGADDDLPKGDPKVPQFQIQPSVVGGVGASNHSASGTSQTSFAGLKLRGMNTGWYQFQYPGNYHEQAAPFGALEVDVRYNMIGRSGEGLTTGLEGRVSGLIGGTLKTYGKNGCDVYGGLNLTGEAGTFFHRKQSGYISGVAGPETGLLCQVADTVAFMISPEVGIGKTMTGGQFKTSDEKKDYETEAQSDLVNIGANARLVIKDRVYLSAQYFHMPKTGDSSVSKPHWAGNRANATFDVKINDAWVAGAQVKFLELKGDKQDGVIPPDVSELAGSVHVGRAW